MIEVQISGRMASIGMSDVVLRENPYEEVDDDEIDNYYYYYYKSQETTVFHVRQKLTSAMK